MTETSPCAPCAVPINSARDTTATSWIAIVDDDDAVRRATARLLKAYSFQVQTYPSGGEFLASLQTKVPTCLIVDLQMDGMMGLEILRRLSGMGLRIPTIVATATDEFGMRHRCTTAGAVSFLVKPVMTAPLLRAVRAAMRAPVRAVDQERMCGTVL